MTQELEPNFAPNDIIWKIDLGDENLKRIFKFDKYINVPDLGMLCEYYLDRIADTNDKNEKIHLGEEFNIHIHNVKHYANLIFQDLKNKDTKENNVGFNSNLAIIAIRAILHIPYKKFNFSLNIDKKSFDEFLKGNYKFEKSNKGSFTPKEQLFDVIQYNSYNLYSLKDLNMLFQCTCFEEIILHKDAIFKNLDHFSEKKVVNINKKQADKIKETIKTENDKNEINKNKNDILNDTKDDYYSKFKEIIDGFDLSAKDQDEIFEKLQKQYNQELEENKKYYEKKLKKAKTSNELLEIKEKLEEAKKLRSENLKLKIQLEDERIKARNLQRDYNDREEEFEQRQIKLQKELENERNIRQEEDRIREEERIRREEEERKREEEAKRLREEKRLKEEAERIRREEEAKRLREEKRLKEEAERIRREEEERKRIEAAEAKAEEERQLQEGLDFKSDVKKAELIYYACIINYFIEYHYNNTNYVNQVFKTSIESQKKVQFYKNFSSEVIELITKTTNLRELIKLYKNIKNDFELLKGPVRVYLKLRKFVRATGDDKNKQLFAVSNNKNEFDITVKKNTICFDKLPKNNVNNMVNTSKEHNFSRIYYSEKNSDDIFDDSIRDTVDNILLTENGNIVVMAYGPSGSGKTYNLIGDGLEKQNPSYGLIYKVLNYLTSQYNSENKKNIITKIELDSWQYYMICGKNFSKDKRTGEDTFECKKFKSLSPFDDKVFNAITEDNSIDEFLEVLSKFFIQDKGNINAKNKFTYKYERDEKHKGGGTRDHDGVQVFSLRNFEEEFDDSSSELNTNDIKILATKALTGQFVSMYFSREYPISDTIKDELQINEGSFNGWASHQININKRKTDSNAFRLIHSTNNIFFKQGTQIRNIAKIIQGDKKLIATFLMPFYQGKNALLIEKTMSEEDINFIQVEAKLFIYFFKKMYNFGQLTIPTYDDLFKAAKKNEKKNRKIVLKIKPENVEEIKRIFTKFYIALTRARPTRATSNNPDSSRTHLCINIRVEMQDKKSKNFLFVDLAGNEQADENYFTMKEEGNGITTSLLAIKNLLKAKQDGEQMNSVVQNLTDNDMFTFFPACRTANEKNTCKGLYEKCLNVFERKAGKNKLLKLDNPNTTVSMYLSLPTYIKKGNSINQCASIADSLFFIHELQEKTKIAGEIKKITDDSQFCKKYYEYWHTESRNASASSSFGYGYHQYRKQMLRNTRKHHSNKRRSKHYKKNGRYY